MRFLPEDLFGAEHDVLAEEYRKHRDIGGGFSIKFWGEERFGAQYWDEVLPLMRDMRRALQTLKRGETVASFDLPDQPVTITLDRNGPRQQLRMSVSIYAKGTKTLLLWDAEEFMTKLEDAINRLERFLGSLEQIRWNGHTGRPVGSASARPKVLCPVCGSRQGLEPLLKHAPDLGGWWGNVDRLAEGFRRGEIHWACDDCLKAGRALKGDPSAQVFCLHAPYLAYYDVELSCSDCRQIFTFSAGEQRFWYEELRFVLHSVPKQCAPCRRRRRDRLKAESELGAALAALKVTPRDPELLLRIADIYLQVGHPRKGAEYLRRAKNQVREPEQLEALMVRLREVEGQF